MNIIYLNEQGDEHMTNTKELIMKLREVRLEKGLSYNDILALMEKNGDHVSKSTLSNVFTEDLDSKSFDYDNTIKPIATALLDIETIEADDDMDTQAMKILLQYKSQRIKELEASLANEKVKYHERLDKEREKHEKDIAFLAHQIELKDKRMDQLLEAVFAKDSQHQELLKLIMSCPARFGQKCEE